MATDKGPVGIVQITKPAESSPLAKNSFSNDAMSFDPHESRPNSAGHAEAVRVILSRTAVARSEGFLRPIADTPPTAPASPRLGP